MKTFKVALCYWYIVHKSRFYVPNFRNFYVKLKILLKIKILPNLNLKVQGYGIKRQYYSKVFAQSVFLVMDTSAILIKTSSTIISNSTKVSIIRQCDNHLYIVVTL